MNQQCEVAQYTTYSPLTIVNTVKQLAYPFQTNIETFDIFQPLKHNHPQRLAFTLNVLTPISYHRFDRMLLVDVSSLVEMILPVRNRPVDFSEQ